MSLNKITNIIRGFPDWHGMELSDFDEWVSLVTQKTELAVFRGQRKYWPLLPSLSRNNHPDKILAIERKLLQSFKKEGKICLHTVPETDWDWLVVGQHHGLPTRILDWSYIPYVALWFALRKHAHDDSEPEVWVLKPSKDDIIENLQKSRPFQGNRTKLFNTDFKIPRIREQDGCFTLFKYIEKSSIGFVPLEENTRLRKRIERIRIAKYAAPIILDQIEKKGIKESIMFPNIDEVARSIRDKVYHQMA